jgi:hypothetical protein
MTPQTYRVDWASSLETQRAGMIRLIHWYLSGLPEQERLDGQKRLLQQVLMSVRTGFERQEQTLRAMHHPDLPQARVDHRSILGGIESLLQTRMDEEEDARLRMRHALDDLLLQQLGESRLQAPAWNLGAM